MPCASKATLGSVAPDVVVGRVLDVRVAQQVVAADRQALPVLPAVERVGGLDDHVGRVAAVDLRVVADPDGRQVIGVVAVDGDRRVALVAGRVAAAARGQDVAVDHRRHRHGGQQLTLLQAFQHDAGLRQPGADRPAETTATTSLGLVIDCARPAGYPPRMHPNAWPPLRCSFASARGDAPAGACAISRSRRLDSGRGLPIGSRAVGHQTIRTRRGTAGRLIGRGRIEQHGS